MWIPKYSDSTYYMDKEEIPLFIRWEIHKEIWK